MIALMYDTDPQRSYALGASPLTALAKPSRLMVRKPD
jgi:hypothetical protein